jgi:transposase
VYRYRTGVAWRDLPARFGPWQTVWKRHARFSRDGTWDRILTTLQARADAREEVDWQVSVDSTVNRATSTPRSCPRNTGAGSNHKSQKWSEPDDHALGRSRGGLSTKVHAAVDGRGRPLAVLVSLGQGGDARCVSRC